MSKVTVIPQTINPITQAPINSVVKRKVCAYARVSTDSDEQYTSYEAQVKAYSKMIKDNPNWEYINVYADEGISGTSTKRRYDFNQMIDDAFNGKIDLIITKSISRFARNTLDTISITRALKRKGIEVYFEKENIWSLDPKSEMILTIMSSVAQEESRSISENVTMGKRWGFQEGKVYFAYKSFLGYKKGDNGKIEIDEEQAKIVREIYTMFLVKGMSCTSIAEHLNRKGIKTPSGRENTKWKWQTVNSILTNEKYKGDALLQKKYTVDFLEHKMAKNNGEVPQYYVENSHPAIIDKYEWQMVQTELERRSKLGAKYSSSSIFSRKIICADCGEFYGAKVWHSNDKYARKVYQCNGKFKNSQKCKTPHLTEEEIKAKFVIAFNLAMGNKEEILSDTKEIISMLTDTTKVDNSISELQNEMEIISEKVKQLVDDNANKVQSQDNYEKRYDNYSKKYEKTKQRLDKCMKEKEYMKGQAIKLGAFINVLEKSNNVITEFDEELWMLMVENAVVNRDKSITFKFYNGKEING